MSVHRFPAGAPRARHADQADPVFVALFTGFGVGVFVGAIGGVLLAFWALGAA